MKHVLETGARKMESIYGAALWSVSHGYKRGRACVYTMSQKKAAATGDARIQISNCMQYVCERIMKIGQYLAKIWTRV